MVDFPNYPVSYGSDSSFKVKVLEASFGDGYTQRTPDGINNIQEIWSVQWDRLDTTSRDEIIDFFVARKGSESFNWTPPRQSLPKKFYCKDWSSTPVEGEGLFNIKAKFEQVFDI